MFGLWSQIPSQEARWPWWGRCDRVANENRRLRRVPALSQPGLRPDRRSCGQAAAGPGQDLNLCTWG